MKLLSEMLGGTATPNQLAAAMWLHESGQAQMGFEQIKSRFPTITLSDFTNTEYFELRQGMVSLAKRTTEDVLKAEFAKFCRNYPGRKGSAQKEWANFKKKYKKTYQTDVFLLQTGLDRLNKYRMQEVERAKVSQNKFVTPYPMLQTWINQQRWLEEFPDISIGNLPQAVVSDRYALYLKKLREDRACGRIIHENRQLSEDELSAWVDGKSPFKMASTYLSHEGKVKLFWDSHRNYAAIGKQPTAFAALLADYKAKCNE